MYVIKYVDTVAIQLYWYPLFLLLLLAPDVLRLQSLERGDEGGHGSAWGGVYLVMDAIISRTSIKSRAVPSGYLHIRQIF